MGDEHPAADALRLAGFGPEDNRAPQELKPIDMLLYCPNCGKQHIDAPDRAENIVHRQSGTVVDQLWTNPPHRSHLCHGCRCIWRPADVPTNGAAELKTTGKADTWPAAHDEEVTAMPAAVPSTPHAPEPCEEERRAATRTEVLSDIDPLVLEVWRLKGHKVGAMLRDAQAAVIELQEKLDDAALAQEPTKHCGSHECKAAQQDGILCADGECRDTDGVPGTEAAQPKGGA